MEEIESTLSLKQFNQKKSIEEVFNKKLTWIWNPPPTKTREHKLSLKKPLNR